MSSTAKFHIGQNVRILNSNKVGTINKIIEKDSGFGYKIMMDGKSTTFAEKYLEAFVDEEETILSAFQSGDFGGKEALTLFDIWFRLKKPIEGNLYSYLGSRTLFNPYQFKPLMKFISPTSQERLFIADEVGVGKTIETGILLMELLARGRIDRNQPILIVCPNVLGPKWQREMEKRFNYRFHLHDSKSLDTMFRIYRESKYLQHPWGIVSIQLLRTSRFMEHLQEIAASRLDPLWALMVVDEAHHMRNAGTESNNLGHVLSDLTQMMVMLSATPLNLRDADLFHQMHILNPALFPDEQTFQAMISPVKSLNRIRRLLVQSTTKNTSAILSEIHGLAQNGMGKVIRNHPGMQDLETRITQNTPMNNEDIAYYDRMLSALSPLESSFTRTLKRESMGHRISREVLKIPVRLSPREHAFYVKTVHTLQEAYLHKGGSPAALGFITNMPMRMLTSSIPAMKDYLQWALINNKVIEDNPYDEDDELENMERPLSKELKTLFEELYEESQLLRDEDTKFLEFSKLLVKLMDSLDNKQILVFSFFRRTLKYLKERLEHEGYRVALISGEVPLTTQNGVLGRYDIMQQFENKEIDILLSSEVGGEGLDFQFCQALVNYDMPYNPMRVEQRIGRLDRFGQQADRIFVANLYLEDTVDERVYTLLYDRIQLVEDSIGYLEPIVGTKLADLQKDLLEDALTEEQIEKRTREIEIALAQAKQEQAKFESNRNELLGDENFVQTIANMSMTEFVKPVDSLRMTQRFLDEQEGCAFEEMEPDVSRIRLSSDLIVKLEHYIKLPGKEGGREELYPLLQPSKDFLVVFNGQKALEVPKAVFLPPTGHWMKFILREYEENDRIRRVFKVKGNAKDFPLPPALYLVPLFEVTFDGFRKELNLAAVPIHTKDSTIPSMDYPRFMRTLSAHAAADSSQDFNLDVESLIDLCQTALENQMEERLEHLQTEQAFITESRIKSLKRGSEVRIDRITRQIDNHRIISSKEGRSPSEDFLRMAHGRIEKDQARTETHIQKTQSIDELTMSTAVVGIALLEIAGDPN